MTASTLDSGILNFSHFKKINSLVVTLFKPKLLEFCVSSNMLARKEQLHGFCYASFSYSCWEKLSLVSFSSRQKSSRDGWYVDGLSHKEITL